MRSHHEPLRTDVDEAQALLDWLGRCENYTSGDCASHRRMRTSEYTAGRWCPPCEVRDRLPRVLAEASQRGAADAAFRERDLRDALLSIANSDDTDLGNYAKFAESTARAALFAHDTALVRPASKPRAVEVELSAYRPNGIKLNDLSTHRPDCKCGPHQRGEGALPRVL